jgi:importin subunit beta-1
MYDYVISLREGIMDAWGGIIGAMKTSAKSKSSALSFIHPVANINFTAQILQPYVASIFELLHVIANDMNRSEALMRASMGVIGDLADAYPEGELVEAFRQDWVTAMIKETRSNREYLPRTIETARWAREQVKRQVGGSVGAMTT